MGGTARLMELRSIFMIRGKSHWQYQKRRHSALTSLFNVCLPLTFLEEPHWAEGQLWDCVYINNIVKDLRETPEKH